MKMISAWRVGELGEGEEDHDLIEDSCFLCV